MQARMLSAHGSLGDHQFGSPAYHWPLIGKTLPYWLDAETNVSKPPFHLVDVLVAPQVACVTMWLLVIQCLLVWYYVVMWLSYDCWVDVVVILLMLVWLLVDVMWVSYVMWLSHRSQLFSGVSPFSCRLRWHWSSTPFFVGLPPAVCLSFWPSRASTSFEDSVGLQTSMIVSVKLLDLWFDRCL